ncbi:MAG TPA: ATP-binding protein [Aggregatilineaceae bacterium]|nr:ATP-binding protein [Aggregatilineaceae bacterium]
MKLLAIIQRRLGWKLFLSHLIVVIIGGAVLIATAQLHTPTALVRHIRQVNSAVGANLDLETEVRHSFINAVNEIIALAAVTAFLAALIVSSFIARRIVGPIQEMMRASQRIAAGNYHERIPVPGDDELGALARAFNHMAEVMEQTEQRRLELIGDVAHELRTPLSSIRVMMEGLTDGVLPPEPQVYASFERELARLQRLVQDLQELSRVESGQIALTLRPVDLVERITAASVRLRPQFEDKQVDLQLDLESDLPPVQADSDRIMEVLINLLGNALQYTPSGGHVIVRATREAEDIHVAVADTGIGILADDLPHLFERFYRVDKSRSRAGGGSGIGLTIAKHFVEAHGGRIWATSAGAGQGSTFAFTLPISP